MLPLECENHRCISAHLHARLSGHETALDISQSVSIKVQGSRLFVTYTIIQGIISSEMEVRTGPLNGQCKKINKRWYITQEHNLNIGRNKIKKR